MKQYLELLECVLANGKFKQDRTGIGCYSVFGYQKRYDLSQGFPIVTTKKILFENVVGELLWFLSGSTNTNDLSERSQGIWKSWASIKDGGAGLIYRHQWRGNGAQYLSSSREDSITNMINSLKEDPFSQRHIVSSRIPIDIEFANLPPCPCLFQFFVEEMTIEERITREEREELFSRSQSENFIHAVLDELGVPKLKLSCQLYQHSGDVFLGVPFNIASYALLTHMIAKLCGYAAGELIHTFGDLYLYANHVEQAQIQLVRKPYKLPTLWLNPDIKNIDEFKFEDIRLEEYKHHPSIKAEVAF